MPHISKQNLHLAEHRYVRVLDFYQVVRYPRNQRWIFITLLRQKDGIHFRVETTRTITPPDAQCISIDLVRYDVSSILFLPFIITTCTFFAYNNTCEV